MRRWGQLAVAAFLVVTFPAVVHAHPELDRALRLYESADFRGSLQAIAKGKASDGLRSEELVRMLELEALVHRALGDTASSDKALRALGSIDPGHAFRAEVPPEVAERFRELTKDVDGPIRLDVAVDQQTTELRIVATPANDPERLAREVIVRGRVGQGAFEEDRNGTLTLRTNGAAPVEWSARAVGPGGVVLATRSSADAGLAPREVAQAATSGSSGAELRDEDDEGGIGWPVWVGIGAGVAAAAIVVTVLLVTSSGDPAKTNVQPPTVVGF